MTKPRSKPAPIVTDAQRTAINSGVNAVMEIADSLYRRGLKRVAKSATAAARAGLKAKPAK